MRCGERCLLPTTCLVQRTAVRTLSLFGIKRQSKHSRCMEILKYGGLCRKTILCVFLCLALPPRTRVCLKLCFVVNDSCLGQLDNFSFGFSYGLWTCLLLEIFVRPFPLHLSVVAQKPAFEICFAVLFSNTLSDHVLSLF